MSALLLSLLPYLKELTFRGNTHFSPSDTATDIYGFMKRIAIFYLDSFFVAWEILQNLIEVDVKGFPRASKYQSLELATFLPLAVLPIVRKLSTECIHDTFSFEDIWLYGPKISGLEDVQFHPNTLRNTSISQVWVVSNN